MNHKNFNGHKKTLFYLHLFSFTRCLEIAVHNITIDSLSFVTRYRLSLISSSNFTSLSFLKLVNELPFFLKRVAKVRLFSLPPNFFALFFSKTALFSQKRSIFPDFQTLCQIMAHQTSVFITENITPTDIL